MSEPVEPDWNRLPHDPVGFFGLPDDFDRIALKRSYNALLKRYKPEKFPGEFQRIRMAYEQLDARWDETLMPFRPSIFIQPRPSTGDQRSRPVHPQDEAGVPPRPDPSPEQAPSVSPESPEATNRPDADASPHREPQPERDQSEPNIRDEPGVRPRPGWQAPLPLTERIATLSPRDLQTELARKPNKTAEEYLLLAIVNDALSDGSGEALFATLLEGISLFPDDAGLFEVLQAYLETVPPEQAERHLERLFEARPYDSTFGLSTPLWFAMAKLRTFAQFRTRYEACVRLVRGPQRLARVFLMLRLWPRIAYNAEPDWWIAQLSELDSVSDHQLPPWCEHQLWELQKLSQHLLARPTFLNGNPLRARMDAALRAYFHNEPTWVEQFLAVNCDIASAYEPILQAFPEIGEVLPEDLQSIWLRVAMECAERDGKDLRQPVPPSTLRAVKDLPAKLRPLTLGFPWNPREWTKGETNVFVAITLALPFLFLLIGLFNGDPVGGLGVALLLTIVVGIPVGAVLVLLGARLSIEPKSPSAVRAYHQILPVLVHFVRYHPMLSHELREELVQCTRQGERLAIVLQTINFDRAFWFYSIANRLIAE